MTSSNHIVKSLSGSRTFGSHTLVVVTLNIKATTGEVLLKHSYFKHSIGSIVLPSNSLWIWCSTKFVDIGPARSEKIQLCRPVTNFPPSESSSCQFTKCKEPLQLHLSVIKYCYSAIWLHSIFGNILICQFKNNFFQGTSSLEELQKQFVPYEQLQKGMSL